MKYLIRVYLFHIFALWLVPQLFGGFIVTGGWQMVFFAGFILSLLMIIVTPLLKILFIPINFLTFGLCSWFVNVIVLYLLTLFVQDVVVTPWIFPGGSWAGFVVPAYSLNYAMSLITATLLVTWIVRVLHEVSES